ncbi:MAG: hypothetical protein ACRDT1_01440 [Micromonosporaceae bacterium]
MSDRIRGVIKLTIGQDHSPVLGRGFFRDSVDALAEKIQNRIVLRK